MKRNLSSIAAAAVLVLAATSSASASLSAQQELASVRYLVGTWACAHTVGTFSGTYTTTYAYALGNLWLRQTYDFPPNQIQESGAPVQAEYLIGYDEQRQGWVRFGAMSNGQYFAIRMTGTDSGWSWKYVSFFKTSRPETPGSDATFTKKTDSEYAVDGPSYTKDGLPVTEHHVCKKS